MCRVKYAATAGTPAATAAGCWPIADHRAPNTPDMAHASRSRPNTKTAGMTPCPTRAAPTPAGRHPVGMASTAYGSALSPCMAHSSAVACARAKAAVAGTATTQNIAADPPAQQPVNQFSGAVTDESTGDHGCDRLDSRFYPAVGETVPWTIQFIGKSLQIAVCFGINGVRAQQSWHLIRGILNFLMMVRPQSYWSPVLFKTNCHVGLKLSALVESRRLRPGGNVRFRREAGPPDAGSGVDCGDCRNPSARPGSAFEFMVRMQYHKQVYGLSGGRESPTSGTAG